MALCYGEAVGESEDGVEQKMWVERRQTEKMMERTVSWEL